MRIHLKCPSCSESSGDDAAVQLEVRNDGVYSVVCDQGHHSRIGLRSLPFELLFEFGVLALIDGYWREAVASSATALERCHEFASRTLLRHRAIPDSEIGMAWKQVAKQSERQLGMFIGLYLAERSQLPPLVTQELVAFRNKVVHSGHFPTAVEAEEYLRAVYSQMVRIIGELVGAMPEAVIAEAKSHGNVFYDWPAPTAATEFNIGVSTFLTFSLAVATEEIAAWASLTTDAMFEPRLREWRDRRDSLFVRP